MTLLNALIIGIILTFSRYQQLRLRLRNVKESIKILIIFCIQLKEICCKVKRLSPAVNFKFSKLWYWPSLKLTWSSFNDSILLVEIFGSLWWRPLYFQFSSISRIIHRAEKVAPIKPSLFPSQFLNKINLIKIYAGHVHF